MGRRARHPSRCGEGRMIDRRTFLGSVAAAGAPFIIGEVTADVARALTAPKATVTLLVNGTPHQVAIEPSVTLLDALREYIGLTGAKKGCDHGQCGACTVHVNGQRVLSCLTLAMQAEGKQVTTIEGLAKPDGTLHPMQRAFIEHDGFQCGYCT